MKKLIPKFSAFQDFDSSFSYLLDAVYQFLILNISFFSNSFFSFFSLPSNGLLSFLEKSHSGTGSFMFSLNLLAKIRTDIDCDDGFTFYGISCFTHGEVGCNKPLMNTDLKLFDPIED